MNWVRDWVFLVIKPFLTQLKNRLLNIKLVEDSGVISFTNSEGVTTTTGAMLRRNDIISSRRRIIYPRTSVMPYYNVAQKGYIVLRYPFEGQSYTMAIFNIDVYIYNTNKSFSLMVGGYDYKSGGSHPTWYNVVAKKRTNMANNLKKVRFVRFLKDGGDAANDNDYTRFGMLIGDGDNVRLPYVNGRIVDGMLGYSGADDARWDNDPEIFVSKKADLPPYKIDITRTA